MPIFLIPENFRLGLMIVSSVSSSPIDFLTAYFYHLVYVYFAVATKSERDLFTSLTVSPVHD